MLSSEEIAALTANRQQNSDSRIRKSASAFLDAIAEIPNGHAVHLMEQRNLHKVLKLIRPCRARAFT